MSSVFAPYLPAFQLRRLAVRAALPNRATEERGHGATLLVDVAGFTGLTDRYAARGPEGAEQLSDMLNAYFGHMTEIIAQHGGDVVLFAGDAVLAVWPNDDLCRATRLAAQCALALDQHPDFKHRAAIGAGALSYFEVGGERGRWLPLLAGDAIAQLGPTRKLARPGEILASTEAWAQLYKYARGEVLDDGEARIDEVTEPLPIESFIDVQIDDHLVRAFVPGAVLQRLDAGHGEWLAEFRPVVVVFIHIAGVEYGTAGTLERLQNVMLAVQKPIQHYEGTVYQFVMDDKGTSVVAAFGLPHHAQENEASRAIGAAQEIHSALSAMAVRASIGIASGRAFCGAYGSSRRRQYTIVGPVINLASRLTGPASGGLLCDEATVKAAHGRVQFEACAPVMIKGRVEPLAVFRPLGRMTEADSDTSVFVGRAAERKQLLAGIARGSGLIGIVGEPGIGKSFLLHDAIGQARKVDKRVLIGFGDAVERSTPYFVWRDLLTALLEGKDPLSLIGEDATLQSWAPLLNGILPLGLEENEVTRAMESEARTDSMQAVVARLFERTAAPLALAIDDLQWLDTASLALLMGVFQRLPDLLVIFTTRPDDASAPPGATPASRRVLDAAELIRLEALSDADTLALVRQRLGVKRIPEELAHFIRERAEGHPFYTDELTLALQESGLIDVRNGEVHVIDLHDANFPDSVQGVVTSRIDRLEPFEQLALKTASVIGRTFPNNVLTDVYPIEHDRPAIPRALESFERADLAHREAADNYLFRHVITQDVAYNSLLFSHRRQLHERVALWYEQHHRDDLSAHYALLAHHWDRAEVPAKAIEYLEKAGIEALNAFSSEECARLFTRVLRIAELHPELADDHRRAECQRYLGDAYQHMTDYTRSREHFGEMLRLVGRPYPAGRMRMVLALTREAARQLLHRVAPKRFVGSAQGEQARDLRNAAVTYRGLTEISYFGGDALGVLYCSICALNCGERVRHHTAMGTGAGALAFMLAILRLEKLGRYYLKLGTGYAYEGGNLSDMAYVDGIQAALTEIALLHWDAAEEAIKRSAEGFARVGYRLRWENLNAGYGYLLQMTGRLDEAQHVFAAVYESARGNRIQNMIFARNGQLSTGLMTGQYRREWAAELEDMIPRWGAQMTEATTAWGVVAQLHLREGDAARAWATAEHALKVMQAHPPDTYYGFVGLAALAMVYLDLWERGLAPVDAREVAQRARTTCGMLEKYSRMYRMGRSRALYCRGRYEALRGRDARKWFRQGVAVARKAGMPWDEELNRRELENLKT